MVVRRMMAVILHKEPQLDRPDLIAVWPGIGNIGVVAVDTLRGQLGAEEFGEIEAWDLFYPRKVVIRGGVLQELEFPSNRFYFKKLSQRDLIFFVGEEQPSNGGRLYAEGKKAYQMASMVLDVAERFGCQRVFTSGAAVAPIHHSDRPKVWVAVSRKELGEQTRNYQNTVLMGGVGGSVATGMITGLNGLLLGVAKKRGFDSICLMGEIPDYLSGAPFPYPKSSRSVLEVLTAMLGTEVDYSLLDTMAGQIDGFIEKIYSELPAELKERIEQRKLAARPSPEAITEEDARWIREHIDDFFKKGGAGDDRPS
jgi:proteasome assembly chaperone (PAC2) family protein